MKFTLEQLKNKSKNRPQGYFEDILSASILKENGEYELSDEDYEKFARKYRGPSILEMIKNAGQAAEEAVASGLDVRNKEETEKCLDKCSICKYLIVDQFRCGQCGCFLSYKVKLKVWHCPINKW